MDEYEAILPLAGAQLPGRLAVPAGSTGIVAFAHGSGSSRHSARNRAVAAELEEAGIATLLFDLLTPEEDEREGQRFDIDLLTERLTGAVHWLGEQEHPSASRVGLFGASTGAAAALRTTRLIEACAAIRSSRPLRTRLRSFRKTSTNTDHQNAAVSTAVSIPSPSDFYRGPV